MFVSMNWIQDYVDLSGLDIPALIHRFTLSTAEVEDVYYKGNDVKNVVAGQIVSIENHPNSKKLHLLKVDVGSEVLDIVCGAPNVQLGMVVPVALEGGRVPAGEIKTATIAGYESHGMCCAADELGISDDHSGLWEIPDDVKLGADITEIYPIKDIIFEVDNKSLTNRPDLWGHYGIAREFAAMTDRPLKPLDIDNTDWQSGGEINVDVKRPDLVYRYSALRVANITKNVSPVTMQIRLYYCGMRAINLLADLTNYLMLEMGQPMHAFDGSKVHSIAIGTPDKKGKFITLDSQERDVDENTLLIYNNDFPVAIAGIMGGLNSEIENTTDSLVLESATFDGVSVRKSSARLGLRTDASMRYEKFLDPEMTVTAIRRFVKLLETIDPGVKVVSKLTDKYVKHYDKITIKLTKAYVDRYTGIDISSDRIIKTLKSLGFGVDYKDDEFTVSVPSWRATKDVSIKPDIIEEITRIYGYDNFEIKSTRSLLRPVLKSVNKTDDAKIQDILVRTFGLHEVMSYIWADSKKFKKLGIEVENNIRIVNGTSPDNEVLRNSMIPTLLSMVYENKSFADTFGIFEIGRVIVGKLENGYADERKRLGVVLYSKTKSEKQLYSEAVDIVRVIFENVKHVEPEAEKTAVVHPYEHPKNTAEVTFSGEKLGRIFTLYPTVRKNLDKTANAVCIELNLNEFYGIKKHEISFIEPSKFPSIDFDLSLVLKEGQTYGDVKQTVESLDIPEIAAMNVIDTFDMPGKSRSVTVRLTFSSQERTLETDEVQSKVDSILKELENKDIYLKN